MNADELVGVVLAASPGTPTLTCRKIAEALLASDAFRALVAEECAAALREAAAELQRDWITKGRHQGLPGCYSSGHERWLRDRADRMTP